MINIEFLIMVSKNNSIHTFWSRSLLYQLFHKSHSYPIRPAPTQPNLEKAPPSTSAFNISKQHIYSNPSSNDSGLFRKSGSQPLFKFGCLGFKQKKNVKTANVFASLPIDHSLTSKVYLRKKDNFTPYAMLTHEISHNNWKSTNFSVMKSAFWSDIFRTTV